MGSDFYGGKELPSPRAIKVHRVMCAELIQLVNRVSEIFPEIEAARPCCSSGIETLCLLNNAIIKAKLLLRHCAMSSKLYLALTGEAILSRCTKSRNLLELSLSQMQSMVPVLLAAKISKVVSDLRSASFSLDPHEKDAGKVLLDLIHRYGSDNDSVEGTALQAIQVAAAQLHISSQKALLIEKRSIKKQLDDIGESYPQKRNILRFFQNILKKYGNLIVKEQNDDDSLHRYLEVESCLDQSQIGVLPEEFKCPLSSRLMYDPVTIASGKTFERMWIQKWFDEGHDTCPQTKTKLPHLELTPNTSMKDQIRSWCIANNVTLSDPSLLVKCRSLDTSSSSISSLSNTMMGDLSVRLDISDSSVGSSDGKQDSDYSYSRSTGSCQRFKNGRNMREIDMQILMEFGSLPWESRCKLVKDIEISLNDGHHNCSLTSCEILASCISKFLKESHDFREVEAPKNGCLLFLAFLKNCRSSILYLEEETYVLLASFLDSDVANESLAVFEELSCHDTVVDHIAASSTLVHILHILTREITKLQEPVLRTLLNFSANSNITSFLMPSTLIPVLLPSLENSKLARYGIAIIENLCHREDFRVFIAETDGCISCISKLLESESYSKQEKAVGVLLSLCNQSVDYCDLVLDEGVIPDLVYISNNGTKKGKAMATELLRLLRNQVDDHEESNASEFHEESNASEFQESEDSGNFSLEKKLSNVSDFQESEDSGNFSMEKKPSSKGSTGIFKKFSIFSKHCSCNSRNTRREILSPELVMNKTSSLSHKS